MKERDCSTFHLLTSLLPLPASIYLGSIIFRPFDWFWSQGLIAPSTFPPAVRLNEDGEPELALLRWGLVPFWILLANSGGAAGVSEKGDFQGTEP